MSSPSAPFPPNPDRLPWLVAALVALPAAVYLGVLAAHAVNAPVSDDYFAILDFLLHWQPASWGDRPGLLFAQFYSHRIPFTHLLAAGLAAVFGDCDLRGLQIVAWTGWLLLLPSLAWPRWTTRAGLLALLPVSLLLMQPQGHTNLLTATGSPGHAWCLLCAFWSVHLALRHTTAATTGAVLLALASALCSINGLFVFPVVAFVHLLARQWRATGLWLAAGAVVWSGYLAGYSLAPQPVAAHAFSLTQLALNATTMVGAVARFGRLDSSVAVITGALLTAGALGLGWQEYRRAGQLDANSGFILFLLLSVLLTAWARVGWDHDDMLQDRYRPYGLMLLAMLYLKVLDRLPAARQRWFTAGLIPLTAVFCVLSYGQTLADLKFSRNWAEATTMNLSLGRTVPLAAAPELAQRAGIILEQAVDRGLIRPPRLLDARAVQQLKAGLPATFPTGTAPWESSWSAALNGYRIEPHLTQSVTDHPLPSFGVLYQDGQPLILPVIPLRARLSEVLGGRRLLSGLYEFVVPESHGTPGPGVLQAVRLAPDGSLSVLWSTRINLHPL